MTLKLLRYLFLFLLISTVAQAQDQVPLKYVRDLPKNLYAARTAVLIGYTTNKETTPEEDAKVFNQYSTQLLGDNQRLGLQLVHFADKNVLLQPAKKQRLLKQYDSLKVNNLLILDITDIGGTGAQGSYVLLLTAYNRTAKLMTAKQRAYTLQSDTYEKLIRDFLQQVNQYSPVYFDKAPPRPAVKPTLAAEPELKEAPAQQNATQTGAKTIKYPTVSLTVEDMQRGNGGMHSNFYYYVGADQRERNAGFFGQHLKKDIQASPDALKELEKYRNYKIAYLAERVVFVGAVALYMSQVWSGDDAVYFNDTQKLAVGLAGGSLILNIILSRKTNQHMYRAIDEYNAFATMQNNTGFYKLKPDNWSLGAVYDKKVVPGITLQWNLR
ncbi:hypothetical protein [Adhaeribacter soli]|uniref:DUF5683 domain-containing protein n=1 Tax=Adhaeribacter soli TaxID=2607655 RepID=A0A5N1IXD6_9BACT|nr:hypothetical protein [Adhaeribacter soli]KAA9333806.1 hypothetical protein F0P94_11230 [Adhaeribacter soli]